MYSWRDIFEEDLTAEKLPDRIEIGPGEVQDVEVFLASNLHRTDIMPRGTAEAYGVDHGATFGESAAVLLYRRIGERVIETVADDGEPLTLTLAEVEASV